MRITTKVPPDCSGAKYIYIEGTAMPDDEQEVYLENGTNDLEESVEDLGLPGTGPIARDMRKLRGASLYARNVSHAHTILLDQEIVTNQTNPEGFRSIRTHLVELERWHEEHTGWRIQRTSGFFRLERHPHSIAPVNVDPQLKRARDFACLVWLLWFAEKRYLSGGGRNRQFLLSQLADEIQEQSRLVNAERALDFRVHIDRTSMWRSLEYLARLGGVQSLEGDVRRWVDDAEQPDNEVLYEFTDVTHSLVEALHERQVQAVVTHLHNPTSALQPGRLDDLAELVPELNRAWRSLLLGPVFLRYDDPEAFAELTKQADEVSEDLAETFGWQLELNNDYACIVRGGTMTAGSGPALSTSSAQDQIILLLCSTCRQRVESALWQPDSYGCLRLTRSDIEQLFAELRQRYGMHWGATVQNMKALELLDEIYSRMRQHGLLRGPDADGELLILPTAARYAITYSDEAVEASSRAKAKASTRTKKSTSKKAATDTKKQQAQMTLNLSQDNENSENADGGV